MSWWKVAGGEEIIGDPPADVLEGAFRRKSWDNAGVLSEVLGSIEHIVAKESRLFPEAAAGNLRFVGVTSKGEVAASNSPAEDSLRILEEAVRNTAETYRERFHRNPTIRELLACFLFVMRSMHEGLTKIEVRDAD